MSYPAFDSPRQAPVWENFLLAELVMATVGRISKNVHAIALEVLDDGSARVFVYCSEIPPKSPERVDLEEAIHAALSPYVTLDVVFVEGTGRPVTVRAGLRYAFLERVES